MSCLFHFGIAWHHRTHRAHHWHSNILPRTGSGPYVLWPYHRLNSIHRTPCCVHHRYNNSYYHHIHFGRYSYYCWNYTRSYSARPLRYCTRRHRRHCTWFVPYTPNNWTYCHSTRCARPCTYRRHMCSALRNSWFRHTYRRQH